MEIPNTILKQLFNSNAMYYCICESFLSRKIHSIERNRFNWIELNARLFSSDKCYDVHESVLSMNTTHDRHWMTYFHVKLRSSSLAFCRATRNGAFLSSCLHYKANFITHYTIFRFVESTTFEYCIRCILATYRKVITCVDFVVYNGFCNNL